MEKYEGKNFIVYCGDALGILPTIDKVDLCLTDPPYGIAINRSANQFGTCTERSRKATDKDWDDFTPSKEYFDLIKSISRNQIIFGANYFWEHFYSSQCYIIWDKRGYLPDVPFCDTEFAWTSFVNRMSKRYVHINHGFIRQSKDERTGHPTQKPSELMAVILEDFSKQGETILDPFMGSASTGVACLRTGRRFIGIEKDESYFKIACERLQREEDKVESSLFANIENVKASETQQPLFSESVTYAYHTDGLANTRVEVVGAD